MALPLNQLIQQFNRLEKLANETLAAEPGALVGVDSLPGSEHDEKVPKDAEKPDPEVTQGLPAGATTAEGAVNGGDAKPLNEGKLEVDQPLLTPDEKPLVTDDALSAKEASDRMASLINDLLSDIDSGQKQASQKQSAQKQDQAEPAAQKEAAQKQEQPAQPAQAAPAAQKQAQTEGTQNPSKTTIALDDLTISKIAAASAAFMAGRGAAENAIQKAQEKKASDRKSVISLIKAACVKAAQADGLDPAAAEAAANNAMAMAGISGEDAAAAEAAADAGSADAAAADAAAGVGDVQIPEDVTEEELGAAIVDLVRTGELDVDTAKALVDELAGEEGSEPVAGENGDITEDEAAEIIAQGLESGEITPEQAKAIVSEIEGGSGAGAEAAAADDAAAAGEADAAQAIQDAQDEAAGAAAAEEAMKTAAAAIRKNAISKVASAVVANRASAASAKGGLLGKVAACLQRRKDAIEAQIREKTASASPTGDEAKYIEGFCKKAAEMGVDPAALARYALAGRKSN